MPGFNTPGGAPNVPRYPLPLSTQETARRHRWRLEISPGGYFGGKFGDIEIYAHKATRPTPEIDVATIHHSQDEIYLPGKNRWAPIDISFYEIIKEGMSNITAEYIYDWWSRDVVNISKSRIAQRLDRPDQSGVGGLKRLCILTQLDGYGDGRYAYILYGCWPEKVSPEDLNFDESKICEISLRLRYDKAVERPPAVQVGYTNTIPR